MVTNKIFLTKDGSHSMFSEQHGVSYHSIHGAIQETEHVFINAALLHRLPATSLFILDIGFGTGLNAYMTYIKSNQIKVPIQYFGIEAYPISIEEAKKLNYSELLETNSDDFLKFHLSEWNSPLSLSQNFTLTKVQQKFEALDYQNKFDIIYFDAFAPNAQPELWEEDILQKMYNALKVNGVFTTYCAKGVVKRTLKKVGFEIEAIPGPPGKREMTRATKR